MFSDILQYFNQSRLKYVTSFVMALGFFMIAYSWFFVKVTPILFFAAFFASAIIAAVIRNGKTENIELFGSIKSVFLNNLSRHSATLLAFLGAIVMHASIETPKEAFVREIYLFINTVGFFIVASVAVFGLITQQQTDERRFFQSLIGGFWTYSVVLWTTSIAGDWVYRSAIASPSEAAMWSISLVSCYWIMRSSIPRGDQHVMRPASSSFKGAPTEADLKCTAAHEAGHAILYAALGSLPSDMKIVVNSQANDEGLAGYVTAARPPGTLITQSFAEWLMLVYLAGKFAETFTLGESTLGSRSDLDRWRSTAYSYLCDHHRGMFYFNPRNEFEFNQNERKMEALSIEQNALLQEFFSMNEAVYADLSIALYKAKEMKAKDIAPYLARVVLPNGFPLPLGRFDTFKVDHG